MNIEKILASGKVVDICDLKPDEIRAWDIVWGLNGINRYNAQSRPYYTVLSHSAQCANIGHALRPDMGDATMLGILLHDASEVYTSDFPKSIKDLPEMAWVRALDVDITCRICTRFGADPTHIDWGFVHEVDRICAAREMQLLWPKTDMSAYCVEIPPKIVINNLLTVSCETYIETLRNLAKDAGGLDALFAPLEAAAIPSSDERRPIDTQSSASQRLGPPERVGANGPSFLPGATTTVTQSVLDKRI